MKTRGLGALALGAAVLACSSDPASPVPTPEACPGLSRFRFPNGNDGSTDPFGAKAAGQARAGKLRDASQIVESPLSRHKVRVGDFALANDRIAIYIESEGRPSGYAPFGGDVIAIEPVGDDGRPRGVSQYGETLVALSRQAVKPEKVSVVADGSDGKAAIVRVSGVLENIPFLDTFKAFSPDEYGFPAALDYVLEPGAEKVTYRLSIANTTDDVVDFANLERVGFFHASRMQLFTEESGFGGAKGESAWVGFDGGASSFFFRVPGGRPIRSELEISGFQLFSVKGLAAEACETKTVDYLELATAGGGIDELLETKRRVFGEAAGRQISGVVREEGGAPLAAAFVHATSGDGRYLTRVRTDAEGRYALHVPGGPAGLTPTAKGWSTPAPTPVPDDATTFDLTVPKRSTIEVRATDSVTNEPLPVRVQIIPVVAPILAPAAFGLREERGGRLWQDFAITGSTVLPVPAGQHRVIVSRGYEYELVDTLVSAAPEAPVVVDAKLRRSVDTAGVMCADFHIHSYYSVDSSDPVDDKLKGAVVDGLDIPVSSEHEWILDFQPVIQRLGLTKWAFGMPSEELTTFSWGHFGVIPIYPREDEPNNGAVSWVGKTPPAFFDQVNALPEKPVLVVNHPSGGGSFASYFSAAGFDRATATGSPALWSESFGAIEVFNDSDFEDNRTASVADWFALLNAGKTYWTVGSSDSHDQRVTHAGYPRTCLDFGHDDPTKLTPEIVRDVLRSGAGTVSGGLFMTATAPDGVGPGGTSVPGTYRVVVQSPSWFSASSLEVIVDGVTTRSLPLTAVPSEEPGKRYDVKVDVVAAQSKARHWVVFHAKGEGDLSPLHARKPFAVSNPIFF